MEDVPVPVFVRHLLLYEVGAVHMENSAPGAFNEAVDALSFGGSCNGIGLVVIYPLEALSPDEFSIKFGMESAGKSAGVSAELVEGVDDLVLCDGLEIVELAVLGGDVNK